MGSPVVAGDIPSLKEGPSLHTFFSAGEPGKFGDNLHLPKIPPCRRVTISVAGRQKNRGGGKVRRRKWIPILFLAAAVGGCGNSVKDQKFSELGTDNNWKSVFNAAVKEGALSKEERSLLQAAMLRELRHVPPPIQGKTVRQVIEDQREWQKANPMK
jgi:hypothetical protein